MMIKIIRNAITILFRFLIAMKRTRYSDNSDTQKEREIENPLEDIKYDIILSKICKSIEDSKIQARLLEIIRNSNINIQKCSVCDYYDYSEKSETWVLECKTCQGPICKACTDHLKKFADAKINVYCSNDCHENNKNAQNYIHVGFILIKKEEK